MNQVKMAKPLIIGALHLPDLRRGTNPPPISYLEDYTMTNAEVFYKNGIKNIYLQDQTQSSKGIFPESIAVMASLGSMVKHAYPDFGLGLTCEIHDPYASLAAAYACNADFVRIKVYVGVMYKTEGFLEGCGIESRQYRDHLGNPELRIFSDVFDRTGYSTLQIPIEDACDWAMFTGTDGFVITGHNYDESLTMIKKVKKVSGDLPVLLGGSANENNIAEVLKFADGAIVSSSLMVDHPDEKSLIRWDGEKIRGFVRAAGL